MDRDQAIAALPAPYGHVVRLLDHGTPAAAVAEQLGIDPEAAPVLVKVAEVKLAELLVLPAEHAPGNGR